MTERVSTLDIRQRIGDLLNRVDLRHDEFIIERKGRALAALVPLARLEQMRRFARREALEALGVAEGRGGDLTEAGAMALAREARKWARKPRPTGR
jgi:antitoxin (DNA-binding transcriptional repressor) of toxin-antitoxin stability system